MSLEHDRLLSLIEFAKHSARLRSKAPSQVAAHKLFALHEHEAQGLLGVEFDAESDGDELWLTVKRLRETAPPEPKSSILRPWVELTRGPETEPKLKASVTGSTLIDAGTHRSSAARPRSAEERALPVVDPTAGVHLHEFHDALTVRSQFNSYLANLWRPWAAHEKQVRRTIRLYSALFTLKQQLDGSLIETPLELVWGVGVAVWQHEGGTLSYPTITRQVEVSMNPVSSAIEVRPRQLDPQLETQWYAAMNNLGVAEVERAGKEFFAKAAVTFSPFDRGTFEPLLRTAVAHLDQSGTYWPNEVQADDRTVPKPDGTLKITDTWVLFARPRMSSVFIQDLEKLEKQVDPEADCARLPGAVRAVVTDPSDESPDVELPSFRGMSGGGPAHNDGSCGSREPRDLFFPKPYNEEQTRIVQLLEVSDGVVVQGPPGTGKTHTIANVICHYLATGRRVLVTSMKDPALAVLREKLPEEIQPLAISLLSSEQEGMAQFERSVHKIASEIQSLDKAATTRAIRHGESLINSLHAKLAGIDRNVSDWVRKNLDRIEIDGDELEPRDAAAELVQGAGEYEWIPDDLNVAGSVPRFSDEDVVRLREARRSLGNDLSYLDCSLPRLDEFPESRQLLQVHQDLSRFTVLTAEVETGRVPAIAGSDQDTLACAQGVVADVERLRSLRGEVAASGCAWTVRVRQLLASTSGRQAITAWEELGRELAEAVEQRAAFLTRPVSLPDGFEADSKLVPAVANLARGESAFGVAGVFGRSAQKQALAAVRVVASAAQSTEDWAHVESYLSHRATLRGLAVRWNALAPEAGVDALPGAEPEHALLAMHHHQVFGVLKQVIAAEDELAKKAARLFPAWPGARDVGTGPEQLAALEAALQHHLTKNRLAAVWAVKEQSQRVLDGRQGPVVELIRAFLASVLGNPEVPDAQMQARWSSVMTELARVLGLRGHLEVVKEVTRRIAESGAPLLAAALREPLTNSVDRLLPDNWKRAWRLRRLATYVDSIDAQQHLKRLHRDRANTEADLARAYQDVVVKRTWLKLGENASDRVRAALQSYLNAIQKIGKGTGKRAVRYRQDARHAATEANAAVPCWIMPHYRVSESLPPSLGCFDLVIIDEASQSDLTALPSLLRAEKVLIVGDDKQVSPDAVGMDEDKVRSLMTRFLGDQVLTYRAQMSPERSMYDLFKVVFAGSAVMLKEHFRCVGPIIEYSKREFYNHELRPLRLPRASERLDPPLIDVVVEDGYRDGDTNVPELRFIEEEIRRLVEDPLFRKRSIGVVSLLGEKQALAMWERLTEALGPETLQRHRIACGDARTFQGKERDIMFLSMVSAPNNVGASLSRESFAQRFNVAASRARDRMYLVRSVELDHLSDADRLRRELIKHFASPFGQDEKRVEDLRKLCESPFERDVYDELTLRGFRVTPQVRVGQYRIDLVVEGENDALLAIECDGDRYHGADKWADDMQRQRVLERAGWVFWRCFASTFLRRREETIQDLVATLRERGIGPVQADSLPRSVHTEQRRFRAFPGLAAEDVA